MKPHELTDRTTDDYREDVRGPGKFDAEPAYVAFFWECSQHGEYSDELYCGDKLYSGFVITDRDREFWGVDLDEVYGVVLWESDTGFVCSSSLADKSSYDATIADLETQGTDDWDDEGNNA